MKKIILALAAVLVTIAAGAQEVNREALLQKIAKSEAAAADAKKATKAATWINVAKSYIDAAIEPTKGLYLDAPTLIVYGIGQPKVAPDQVTVGGRELVRIQFDYITVYVNESNVVGWEETAYVTDKPIDKAIAALEKAYQVEPKQAPKIRTELVRISNYCNQSGQALNGIEKFAAASREFETAFRAESNPAYGTPDLTRLYYAGTTAAVGGATDPALYLRAEELLNKVHEMGFEDDKGMIYYYLYHAYYGQRKADPAKLQKAKAVLLLGRQKHEDNEELLESLINLYSTEEGMGDPAELVASVDERIAADPADISLWFSRAQIFVKLQNYDEAVASLDKAIAIDPNSYTAQFFAGYYLVMKADVLNETANSKSYTSQANWNADQQEILTTYERSVPYLERAHAIDASQINPVMLLKEVYFRLRDSEGMMDKFEKYKALEEQMTR